jgi:ketosteroid isomerase-like protein
MTQRGGTEAELANARALRPVYDQWSRGNWQPRFEVYADDFEWGWSEEFPDHAGVSRDPGVGSERLRTWLSGWEDWRCEAEDLVASGEYVVALCLYTGRGPGSGVDVEQRGAHLWTMREGRAVRLEVFSSRERAFRAAGIEPGRTGP